LLNGLGVSFFGLYPQLCAGTSRSSEQKAVRVFAVRCGCVRNLDISYHSIISANQLATRGARRFERREAQRDFPGPWISLVTSLSLMLYWLLTMPLIKVDIFRATTMTHCARSSR
jgi:hypothetical protein